MVYSAGEQSIWKMLLKNRKSTMVRTMGTMSREEIENVWAVWGVDLPVENERVFRILNNVPAVTSSLLNQKNPAN